MVTSPKKAAFSWHWAFVLLSVGVSGCVVGVGEDGSGVLVGSPVGWSSVGLAVGPGWVGAGLSLGVEVGEAATSSWDCEVGVMSLASVEVTPA